MLNAHQTDTFILRNVVDYLTKIAVDAVLISKTNALHNQIYLCVVSPRLDELAASISSGYCYDNSYRD